MAAYLTRWLTPETLSAGAMNGYFFESFVFAEIFRSYINAGKEADFYFLRDGNQREIDLLIHENDTLYLLEMKIHTEPTSSDIKHFSMIENMKNLKIGEGGIICLSNEFCRLKTSTRLYPFRLYDSNRKKINRKVREVDEAKHAKFFNQRIF